MDVNSSFSIRFLGAIERYGNRLPEPAALFFYLCLFVIALSTLGHWLSLGAQHPLTKEYLHTNNLLSPEGLQYILTSAVGNFMSFAPLGPVLVAMIGIGIAEQSGLLEKMIRSIVRYSPTQCISYSVVFGGILSNLAADAGYVVYIPLCAMIYKNLGRAPLAGIAAAFAGVSGGYSANIMVGPVDIILSGLTQEAARLIETDFQLPATSNYYFLCVSTVLITLCGGYITDRIIEPYLKKLQAAAPLDAKAPVTDSLPPAPSQVGSEEFEAPLAVKDSKLALQWALISIALYTFSLIGLRHFFQLQEAFLSGLVVLISMGFAIGGMVFGKLSGRFQSSKDWVEALVVTFEQLSGYLVLMFFASQFVAWFNWSQLGPIFAIHGADWINQSDISNVFLIATVLVMTSVLNLFIGSASAKWALLAPIFVPMLMLADISPAWAQIAYRVGDSSTNIITPLMPYFALVLAFAQQHHPNIKIGRLLAVMIPYSVGFLIFWSALLLAWYLLNWPLGF